MKRTILIILICLPLALQAQQPFLFGDYTLDWGLGYERLIFSGREFEYKSFMCTNSWYGKGHWEIRDNRLILHFETPALGVENYQLRIISQKPNSVNPRLNLKIVDGRGFPIEVVMVKLPRLQTGFITDEEGKGTLSLASINEGEEVSVRYIGKDIGSFVLRQGCDYAVEMTINDGYEVPVPAGETWIYRIEKSGPSFLLLDSERDDEYESYYWEK